MHMDPYCDGKYTVDPEIEIKKTPTYIKVDGKKYKKKNTLAAQFKGCQNLGEIHTYIEQ